MPPRFAYRRKFVNRAPVLQHRREPDKPLPLAGCKCDDCENARVMADDRIGRVMGEPGDIKPEDRP